MIFQSDAMQKVLTQALRFAKSSATVLIVGESGTGKELVARYLHEHSQRAAQPCVRVNCASFNEGLAESELFGHEIGAFTGAVRRHEGCIQAAGSGTLFLDEIGELPLSTQAKLLRVLEENEYNRVGSTTLLQMQARVIAATNRDLEAQVRAGKFREDLFHRLDVLTLRVPSLRDRPSDIPVLVDHFIRQFREDSVSSVLGVSPDVMRQLLNYRWPGNIRQLRNVIHRACVVAETDTILSVDLGASPAEGDSLENLPEEFDNLPLWEIERRVILARLERFEGNKEEAAAQLGVTSRTLRNKLAVYRELKKAG
ncbi:MAG: sigma-54-dependent Fis family transcriptional regulator [Planctomyces sp.]|nr:sigma-54-dependent Fis family transcriptional regulator [Planctomyces sp.]